MNHGEIIRLKGKELPRVKSLLLELKEKNGDIGGRFELHDFHEPYVENGKIMRFIANLDESSKVDLVIGRDYFYGQGLETRTGLGLKITYRIDQLARYHCPQTKENIGLFGKYLEI